jgi:hypothetical protein
MSKVIEARDLQLGHIIQRTAGNPTIRGTVSAINRYRGAAADLSEVNRMPCGQNVAVNRVPNDCKLRTPPSLSDAHNAAMEEQHCYAENDITSVAVRIGPRIVSLPANAQVEVWVGGEVFFGLTQGK